MKCPLQFVTVTIFVISSLRVTGAFPSNSDVDSEFRANAELICYECARTPENDTCAYDIKLIPEVTAAGQNFRCRVYEMDGHVVARGIVPSILCTPQAFAQINLNIAHLAKSMNASGPVQASCCNKDHCNVNFCTSEGRLKDCTTLVSVLNGEIANYVESDVVKKQIDVNNKVLGNVATETTTTSSNSPSTSTKTTVKTTSTGGGSTATVNETSAAAGNEVSADSEYEFIGTNTSSKNEIMIKNQTLTSNSTATSKLSSSLQLEGDAALEPLTSRKGGAGALHASGALLIALLSVAHLSGMLYNLIHVEKSK